MERTGEPELRFGGDAMPGLIYQMLVEDHRRLEGLLALVETDAGVRGAGAYEEFRRGLLRHIGMEENILIPSAHRARGGERLTIAERIRLDHGALAALLVSPQTPEIIACIKAILSGHNPVPHENSIRAGFCPTKRGAGNCWQSGTSQDCLKVAHGELVIERRRLLSSDISLEGGREKGDQAAHRS